MACQIPFRSGCLLWAPALCCLLVWPANTLIAATRTRHGTSILVVIRVVIRFHLPDEYALLRRLGGRLAEFRWVNRGIDLDLVELNAIPSVEPGKHQPKRHFNSAHLAVIRIVDLGGN